MVTFSAQLPLCALEVRAHVAVFVPVPVSCQQSGTEPFAGVVSREALASMLPPRLAALEIVAAWPAEVAWVPSMSVARAVTVTGPSPDGRGVPGGGVGGGAAGGDHDAVDQEVDPGDPDRRRGVRGERHRSGQGGARGRAR